MPAIAMKRLPSFLLLALVLPWASSPAANRPNIIFILSDDVGQGDLGCYGQKLIKTPHLDRMAAEGTRYMQAYTGTSVCAPHLGTLRADPEAHARTGLGKGHGKSGHAHLIFLAGPLNRYMRGFVFFR